MALTLPFPEGMAIRFQSPFKIIPKQNILSEKSDIRLIDNSVRTVNLLGQIGLTTTRNYDTTTVPGQAMAYALCPVVTGIINVRANAFCMGRWVLEDKDGNPFEKTLFSKLMNRPNPLQNWKQFVNNAKIFKDIFGRCYMMPVVSEFSGDPLSAGSIWIIPNWLVLPQYTGKIWMQSEITGVISGYTITGFNRTILPQELMIWDDTGVNTSRNMPDIVTYQSRLFPLTDQVSNCQRAYEARRRIMTKGGPPGAWVNDNAKDIAGQNIKSPTEINEVQTAFQNQYGLGDNNPYLYAVLNSAWKFVSAGSPTKDLMLFEEIKDDAYMIAFAYNLPDHLMPWSEGKTFNNAAASEKRFYANATIPDAEDLSQVISQWFKLEERGILLKCYFDHLDCF